MKTLKDFATKTEFYQYLVDNKKEILEFKKSIIKVADPFSTLELKSSAIKSLLTNFKDDPASGSITRTVITNTYNWMDSHDDAHVDNTFAQSISQRQDKIWHLHDHKQELTAKVGNPQSIYEKPTLWKDLNVNKEGSTICLMADSNILAKYNQRIFDGYLNKEINQHSVGMIYKTIFLAINDPLQKEEYAAFMKYAPRLGNIEKVMEQGYFFPVPEAMLIEFSCVLAGSNELTPTVDNQSKNEPPPKEEVKCDFYSRLAKQFN